MVQLPCWRPKVTLATLQVFLSSCRFQEAGGAQCSVVALVLGRLVLLQIRHQENVKLQWQNRPLTDELITCAAADVTYLIPLMETQVSSRALCGTVSW